MNSRLLIVEGLPCSGKSTVSAFLASRLERNHTVCYVDEGSGCHPADYEFHALAPAGLLSEKSQVVSLAEFEGELLEKLLQYKIYDSLPWETEMPLMLEKWKNFVRGAAAETVYVFNCVLLQNPMCETMMRFGMSEEASGQYIAQIAQHIQPMHPIVIYLKNDEIAVSVEKAAKEREGWLDAVVDYHVNGAYGKSIGANGFSGYIRCLKERQERELRILSDLSVRRIILDNPQRDWKAAYEMLEETLCVQLTASGNYN